MSHTDTTAKRRCDRCGDMFDTGQLEGSIAAQDDADRVSFKCPGCVADDAPAAPATDLDAPIAAVLASEDHDLGMTEAEAEALRDAIADAGLTDDAAMQAYDLLHSRAVFGRAF